ncbi:hypothetical protein ACFL0V_05125 [Nanoarchaeota archaeon]
MITKVAKAEETQVDPLTVLHFDNSDHPPIPQDKGIYLQRRFFQLLNTVAPEYFQGYGYIKGQLGDSHNGHRKVKPHEPSHGDVSRVIIGRTFPDHRVRMEMTLEPKGHIVDRAKARRMGRDGTGGFLPMSELYSSNLSPLALDSIRVEHTRMKVYSADHREQWLFPVGHYFGDNFGKTIDDVMTAYVTGQSLTSDHTGHTRFVHICNNPQLWAIFDPTTARVEAAAEEYRRVIDHFRSPDLNPRLYAITVGLYTTLKTKKALTSILDQREPLRREVALSEATGLLEKLDSTLSELNERFQTLRHEYPLETTLLQDYS